ncbi:MAG: hypothetical protein RLZZ196_807 [Bacteroidota bacterium]|jgi:hypothetical protein
MSYELKEEFLFRHEDGSYRGYDTYHFLFEGYEYEARAYFRPDEINGGTEFEMSYMTERDYMHVSIKNAFRLYKILTDCYLESYHRLLKKVDDIPHLKLAGFTLTDNDEMIEDKRKDRIAIKYIKKVLPIEKIFVDLNNNTILVIDKNRI